MKEIQKRKWKFKRIWLELKVKEGRSYFQVFPKENKGAPKYMSLNKHEIDNCGTYLDD